jgi:glycosyltransferase involved in cell wall biosynthesis
MPVAFIVPPALQPPGGGGARYLHEMIAALRGIGERVEVFELADDLVAGGRPTIDPFWSTLPKDAVLVIDGLVLPRFARLADGSVMARCVALVHHPSPMIFQLPEVEQTARRKIEQGLLKALPRIVVTGDDTAARLASEYGVDPAHIRVVPPGTAEAPRSTGSGGSDCAILSIGALTPRKGHAMLIRALARLFDLDWHLTIAGDPRDGVHARELAALATELEVTGRIDFRGAVDDAALEHLWRQADLFALATRYEATSAVVAEALKRGLPVAVTRGGAAAVPMTPDSGIVCDPDDMVTFSKAIRRLIFDLPLRRSCAEAAWQIGQTLPDWPTQARAMAAALAGLN